MIQKIKVIPSEIEKILDPIDPKWKEKDLYNYQWSSERSELNPRKIFDLKNFKQQNEDFYIIFTQGEKFLVEVKGHLKDILTNIKPSIQDKQIYNPRKIKTIYRTISGVLPRIRANIKNY